MVDGFNCVLLQMAGGRKKAVVARPKRQSQSQLTVAPAATPPDVVRTGSESGAAVDVHRADEVTSIATPPATGTAREAAEEVEAVATAQATAQEAPPVADDEATAREATAQEATTTTTTAGIVLN